MEIEGKQYDIEYVSQDPFVAPELAVAYCDQLASDLMPVILDPKGHGSKPYPPDFVAYRLVVDHDNQRLCIMYEVYWGRQDCSWKELNKDHDHDYEQIQVHFDLRTGSKEKIIVSSVGPIEHAGHGIEIFSDISKAQFRDVKYITSPKGQFPWGGDHGQSCAAEIREMPFSRMVLEKGRPVVEVLNCYHAFAGLKRRIDEGNVLNPRLERLDRELLERWYYHHARNRFGHDISKPFDEPYVMYYPPPEDMLTKLVYQILWLYTFVKASLVG